MMAATQTATMTSVMRRSRPRLSPATTPTVVGVSMPRKLKKKKRQKPIAVSPARKLIQSKLTTGNMRAQKIRRPPMRTERESICAAALLPTSFERCRRPSQRATQNAIAEPHIIPIIE